MTIKKTEAGQLLVDLVLLVFRLERGFMDAAEAIAGPAGLTAARWKVLGAILDQPRTVAEIGRTMGLTRQSVQRLADLLVAEGLAAYQDNPAHRSAKLVTPSRYGRAAIDRLRERHATWANTVTKGTTARELVACKAMVATLIERVEQVERDREP